jgi:outer membrane protein OmpA-like peptidoglycan-associated protein
MAHDVFISYASENQDDALKVRKGLETGGIRCWMAPRDIPLGEPYGKAIFDAIDATQAMVVVFSGKTSDSPHVATEADRAFNKGKRIILFRLEDVEPSEHLAYVSQIGHWLDAFRFPFPEALKSLIAAVDISKRVPYPVRYVPRSSRIHWWAVAITIVVAVGVVTGYALFVKPPERATVSVPEPNPQRITPSVQQTMEPAGPSQHKPQLEIRPDVSQEVAKEKGEEQQYKDKGESLRSDLSSKGKTKDCAEADRYAHYAAEKSHAPEERIYALEKALQLCASKPALRIALAQVHQGAAESVLLLIETGRKKGHDLQEAVDSYNAAIEKATRQFEEALKLDENNYDALMGLGKLYAVHQGRYEQALKLFTRAVNLKPVDRDLLVQVQRAEGRSVRGTSPLITEQEIVKELSRRSVLDTSGKMMSLSIVDNVTRAILEGRKRFANIKFDAWSAKIERAESKGQLQEIGNLLVSTEFINYRAIIEAHTGNRRPDQSDKDLVLSQARGDAIKDYLVVNFGISSDRIVAKGFGSSRPLVPADDPTAAKKNDRVEITFIPMPQEGIKSKTPVQVGTKTAASERKEGLAVGQLFALTIGISRYLDGTIAQLPLSAKDASDFGGFLKLQKELFQKVEVTTLTDESATRNKILSSIFEVLRKTNPGDTVILYFSGHGATDPGKPDESYLVTYDASPSNLHGTALNLSRLDFLKRLGEQKVIIFMDLCQSGGFSQTGRTHPNKLIFNRTGEGQDNGNVAVITASRSDEVSQEAPLFKNSLFTHNLLRALRGEAKRDEHGVVTLRAVYEFVADQTRQATGGSQQPQLLGPSSLENAPISLP